ncbi:MAG: TlpA disulfide reductase family protein [Planctomycetales bacterium]
MRNLNWSALSAALVICVLSGCGSSSGKPASPTAQKASTDSASVAATDDAPEDAVAAEGPAPKVKALPISARKETGDAGPVFPGAAKGSAAEEMAAEDEDDEDLAEGIKDLAEGESPELKPKEGSPEWYLHELVKLQLEPFAENLKPAEVSAAQAERLKKIAALARKAVAQTHDDKSKARVFDVAVHRLIDAQVSLALLGDKEGVDGVYDSAKSLFQRDPKSKVASDAWFALVNLAFTNAHNTAGKDDRWVKEYARLARQFVTNFPADQRGIRMLFNAALGCEWNNCPSDAYKTYALLQKQFPESEQGLLIPAIHKRLKLQGEPLALSGPSLENGKAISLKSYKGKTVALLFWSAQSDVSAQVFPALAKLQSKHDSLQIVGVCVDEDKAPIQAFLKEMKFNAPMIFFSEKGQTGWSNPIVKEYGVLDQSAWLIDPDGSVISTSVTLNSLERQLSSLLKHDASRDK